jgi:hypothetical protein
MNHHVVVEIERAEWITKNVSVFSPPTEVISMNRSCWNILYKAPIQSNNHPEPWDGETLSFDGCLAWIENNKVEGSKYAVVKMYLV